MVAAPMAVSQHDRDILRPLAEAQAEIAALPVQREKARLWTQLNDLHRVRPLVWFNDELCWNEMNINDELTLRTNDPWARQKEMELRRLLYRWRHFRGDTVVSDYLACRKVVHSTGFGLSEQVDVARTDETSETYSRRYHRQISTAADLDKMHAPEVTYDAAATQEDYERTCEAFDGILPVRIVGLKGFWSAPWDELIQWWTVEAAMIDLIDRPEMVKAAISRLVDLYLCELDQFERLGVLSVDNDNTRVGSGGYGYTSALPGPGFNPDHVTAKNMWGCSTAQIFSDVSPEMHWEFALQHELRWLQRFGLTYYGCCEPLHHKVELLKRVPNLRKVSMSPRADVEKGAAALGTRYVYSMKPNPAIFASDVYNGTAARRELREALEKTRGCIVEVIPKDISTVRYEPQRLWEWAQMASQLVEEYA